MLNRRALLKNLVAIPLVISTSTLIACSDKKNKYSKLPKGSKVIALGDSLTYGYGANKETAYPTVLAELTGWNVINSGINGNTSQDILNRLDKVIAQQPELVLLGIGGNDVLRKIDSQITKNNIIEIIQKLKAKNIHAVLIAQPYFSTSILFGKATDNPIYQEIAESEQVPLFKDGWSAILSDKSLRSDQIHANATGYKKFAANLYQYLKELEYV